MKSKIILVDPCNNETLVATMRSTVEAFQCASLLQAIAQTEGYQYFIEHRSKGINRRTRPDTFTITVSNLTGLYNSLKPIFNLTN